MPDVKLSLRSKGAGRAALDLTRVGDRGGDVRPAKDAVRPLFQADEKQRFDRQGPRWPPLAERTRELKAQAGLDPRVLRSSGKLYDSLITAEGETPRPTQIVFGTEVWYSKFHQAGTKRMPRRKVIQLSKRTRDEMVEVLTHYVSQGRR